MHYHTKSSGSLVIVFPPNDGCKFSAIKQQSSGLHEKIVYIKDRVARVPGLQRDIFNAKRPNAENHIEAREMVTTVINNQLNTRSQSCIRRAFLSGIFPAKVS